MRGGSDSSDGLADDEPTGQRTAAPQDGPQATGTGTATEVVRGKAGEGKTERVRKDLTTDSNG